MHSTFLRFLSRNKLYTFIEVFGLSVSLGFILLLAGYVGTDVSVGRGQKMSKELYVAGSGTYLGMTLGAADEFFPSVPQIDRWTRMSWRGDVDVSVGEDIYSVNAIDIPMDDSHGAVFVFDDADPDGWAGYVVLKTHGDHAAAVKAISTEASRLADEMLGFPYEFEVQYLDDYFAGTLDTSRNMMKLVFIFMVLAILISALGLFAMSIYYTEQQGRRIAISKVFGSDEGRVVRRLSRNFIVLSLIAAVVAVPLSFFVMERYLQSFHNRIDFPWWVLVAAAVLSLLISFVAIISRTVSASRKNPVETLKQE